MPKTRLNDSQLVILNVAAKAGRPIGKDDLSGLKVRGRCPEPSRHRFDQERLDE